MIQRCYLPKWKGTFLCSDAQMTIYYTKFQQNIDLAHMFHQNLYLGQGKLQQFADPRLVVSQLRFSSTESRAEQPLIAHIWLSSCARSDLSLHLSQA